MNYMKAGFRSATLTMMWHAFQFILLSAIGCSHHIRSDNMSENVEAVGNLIAVLSSLPNNTELTFVAREFSLPENDKSVINKLRMLCVGPILTFNLQRYRKYISNIDYEISVHAARNFRDSTGGGTAYEGSHIIVCKASQVDKMDSLWRALDDDSMSTIGERYNVLKLVDNNHTSPRILLCSRPSRETIIFANDLQFLREIFEKATLRKKEAFPLYLLSKKLKLDLNKEIWAARKYDESTSKVLELLGINDSALIGIGLEVNESKVNLKYLSDNENSFKIMQDVWRSFKATINVVADRIVSIEVPIKESDRGLLLLIAGLLGHVAFI